MMKKPAAKEQPVNAQPIGETFFVPVIKEPFVLPSKMIDDSLA
jgi:hypothetical protein